MASGVSIRKGYSAECQVSAWDLGVLGVPVQKYSAVCSCGSSSESSKSGSTVGSKSSSAKLGSVVGAKTTQGSAPAETERGGTGVAIAT